MLSFFTYIRNDRVSFSSNSNKQYINIKNKLTSLTSATLNIILDVFGLFGSQKGFEIYKILQKYKIFRCRHAVVIMQIAILTNQCSLFTTVRW